jgi:hypothetical protein
MQHFLVILLVLSFFTTALSLPAASHQPNTNFCTPTSPGVCNFGWEWFCSQSAKQNSYKAWVYDRYCNTIANCQNSVSGYFPSYRGPGRNDYTQVLYHIDCSPNLPYNVIMTNVLVWEDKESPVFYYAGRQFGGRGCSCYQGGLDPDGVWACQCAFDC